MGFAGLQFSSFEDRSRDWALAHFPCEMSQDRLRRTPREDLELAFARMPRGRNVALSAVYVIGNNVNGLHKIGYADNLQQRVSGLNCGSPVDLELAHFVYFVDGFIAKAVEGDVHKLLAEHRRKGEWFMVSAEQAGEAIAEVVTKRRLRWWTEEERRLLWAAIQNRRAHYEERKRFFGT